MITKSLISSLLILITISYAHPKDKVRELSLRESLAIVTRNDPILKSLRYDGIINEEELSANTKDFLPKITSQIKRTKDLQSPRGTTIFTSTSSAEMPIYDRSIIYKRRKIKKQEIKNKYKIQQRLNDLTFEIANLYFYIHHLKKLIKITKEEYAGTKESYLLNKRKLKLEKIIAIDLLLVEGLMLETENKLKLNISLYNEAMLRLKNKLRIKEDFILKEEKGLSRLELEPLEYYIKQNQRKELELKEIDSLIAKDLYEVERSIFYPRIDIGANVEFSSFDNYSLSDSFNWSFFVMASFYLIDELSISLKGGIGNNDAFNSSKLNDEEALSISLFDNNQHSVTRVRAKYNYLNQVEKLHEYKLQLKEKILTLYNNVLQNKRHKRQTLLYLKIGEGLVKKLSFEYDIGKKGMEELIETQKKHALYKVENEIANFNINKSVLNLKKSIGTLSNYF